MIYEDEYEDENYYTACLYCDKQKFSSSVNTQDTAPHMDSVFNHVQIPRIIK